MGQLLMFHANAMPCRINGKDYPSQKAAAETLGFRATSICKAIADGRADNVGLFLGRKGNKNRGRRITLFGVEYPSHKDAAAALGLERTRFRRLIAAGTPEAHDALLAAKMRMDAMQRRAA